ncbi:MAG: phosphate ABC transporter permease subunit PstC, partial [Rhodospirillaceae bacterium]|nr:phosphate ABC transporter permease subunit PstC [Rhodospirillaceae bacterium]
MYVTLNPGNRKVVEGVILWILVLSSTIAILTTLGIVASLLFESVRFFKSVPLTDFLFGLEWSPQTAIRSDQVGASGTFGAIPLLAGTALISAIAMMVAGPLGLFAAIYLAEYSSNRMRSLIKPALEILAGIPTVVYGFLAALIVAPFLRSGGEGLGFEVSSESALAAGLVMGVMIIPIVSSLSDDVIRAVPQSLREGSLGLGSTRAEMISKVVLPAAFPGIVSAMLLATSRAIGETMIVVMAAGLAAKLTAKPLPAGTPVTGQNGTLHSRGPGICKPKTPARLSLCPASFLGRVLVHLLALRGGEKFYNRAEHPLDGA